jgi:hypothetical protein
MNNNTTLIGTGSGFVVATLKAMIQLDTIAETIVYAAIGALTGLAVTETVKWIIKKIKSKK